MVRDQPMSYTLKLGLEMPDWWITTGALDQTRDTSSHRIFGLDVILTPLTISTKEKGFDIEPKI